MVLFYWIGSRLLSAGAKLYKVKQVLSKIGQIVEGREDPVVAATRGRMYRVDR
jgi:uncharacterized membrane protein YjjP (DUF1212 family)